MKKLFMMFALSLVMVACKKDDEFSNKNIENTYWQIIGKNYIEYYNKDGKLIDSEYESLVGGGEIYILFENGKYTKTASGYIGYYLRYYSEGKYSFDNNYIYIENGPQIFKTSDNEMMYLFRTNDKNIEGEDVLCKEYKVLMRCDSTPESFENLGDYEYRENLSW